MLRASVTVLLVMLGTNALAEDTRQMFKTLINAQFECFKIGAFSKAIKKVDLETAAYAVAGRCTTETQRFKIYSATHNLMNPVQFEAYWAEEERKDILTIKRLIAVARTL
jgi:flagellar biosynthesis regulator FlbT